MIIKYLILLLIFSTSSFSQDFSSGGSSSSSAGIKLPIEFLFCPLSYSETETSSSSVSTFTGTGMIFRGGISFGIIDILGNYETATQKNDMTVGGIFQNKEDTGFGGIIKFKYGRSFYLGAGYSILNSTIKNSGASTSVSKLSGKKMYALVGYNLNLFGSFKLFGEGTYIISGEYVSSDGVDFTNPILITGFSANVGIGLSF